MIIIIITLTIVIIDSVVVVRWGGDGSNGLLERGVEGIIVVI